MRPAALSSLLLLGLVAAHLVGPSSAGFILDKVGQAAKDVHEKVHTGAEKLGTGIKNLFGGGGNGEREAASSESPAGEASSSSSSSTEASTAGAGAGGGGGSSTTTVDPRYVIGPIKRCNPGEQLFAGECRAAE